MSMRTLLEIDHNMLHRIKERPEELAALLSRALGSGCFDDEKDDLWRFGVRLASMKHSSYAWELTDLAELNYGAKSIFPDMQPDDAQAVLGSRIYERCMKSVKYATAFAASAVKTRQELIVELNALQGDVPSKAAPE